MHRVVKVVVAVAGILLVPSIVFAQATIAGVVRDASAAVLPGVTVEASSPVLIEKTRTVVSDGTGQYRITDLPPGTYVLTFSLSGFSTVKREGLAVSGSGVIPVNVDLRVGGLQETVTVSGEAPVVDTQSVRREVVLNAETLNTLPATRGYGSALAAVPALNIGGVAGAGAATAPTTPSMMFFTAHGGASGEGRLMTNGLTVAAPFGGGGVSDVTYDIANAEEMQVLISGGLGESETGGPMINIVPKSGGNQFRGAAFFSTAGDWATSNNVDDQLRSYGITQPPTLRKNWDVSGSLGGPVKKDRLWFFAQRPQLGQCRGRRRDLREPLCRRRLALGLRRQSVDRGAHPGVAPDLRGPFDGPAHPAQPHHLLARLPAPMLGVVAERKAAQGCRQAGADWVGSGRTFGADTVSPESFPGYHDFPYNTTQLTYSAPISSRLLLEAGFSRFAYDYARFGMAAPDGLMDLIPVTEQSGIYGRPQFTYRGVFDPLDFGFNDNKALQSAWRAALSYVTGAHNLKVGYQGYFSAVHNGRVPNNTQLRYTFNNQVPISVSYFLAPRWDQHDRTETFGMFAQDQWTAGRLTLQGAVRFDRAWSWAPADGNGATGTSRFNPQPISFDRNGQRARLQRHHAAPRDGLRRLAATARRQSRSTSAGISRRPRPTSSTAPTTRPRASSRASVRAPAARRAAGPTATATTPWIATC